MIPAHVRRLPCRSLVLTGLRRGAVCRRGAGAVPNGADRVAAVDAAHIAIAATRGVEYLVTWNFRHIADAAMRVRIECACREAGYAPPTICTQNGLMETGHGDDPA